MTVCAHAQVEYKQYRGKEGTRALEIYYEKMQNKSRACRLHAPRTHPPHSHARMHAHKHMRTAAECA